MTSYKYRFNASIIGIACLLLVANNLAIAGISPCNQSTSHTSALAPELLFDTPEKESEVLAALICNLIETRTSRGQPVNEIYLDDVILWSKVSGINSVLDRRRFESLAHVNPVAALQDPELKNFIYTVLCRGHELSGVEKSAIDELLKRLGEVPPADPEGAIAEIYGELVRPNGSASSLYRAYSGYRAHRITNVMPKKILPWFSGGVVVNVGCNRNALGVELLKREPRITRLIGTDIKDYGVVSSDDPRLEFRLQKPEDDYRIPMEDNSADLVILSNVLHHVDPDNKANLLMDILRIMKPGAKVVIIEDTYSDRLNPINGDKELIDRFLALSEPQKRAYFILFDWLHVRLIHETSSMVMPGDNRSIEEWVKLLRDSGFNITYEEFSGFTDGVAIMIPKGLIVVEKPVGSVGDVDHAVHQVFNNFISGNQPLVSTLLQDSNNDVLLRVPIEAIEYIGEENVKGFLKSFGNNPNSHGFVELYSMASQGEVSREKYGNLGLDKERLKKFNEIDNGKRTKENTITLLPVSRGEIDDDDVKAQGQIDNLLALRTGNIGKYASQVVPIGFQHDALGLIRSTLMGLRFIHIARRSNHAALDADDKFVEETIEQYKSVCQSQGVEGFNLSRQDIIDIATGSPNGVISALRKLIRLLPVTPIDANELKKIYEHAREVITAV